MMDNMSKHADPLGKTAPELHRFYVRVRTAEQWYAVMAECRAWFGLNWRTMPKVRRKFNPKWSKDPIVTAWFEVPDLRICTWIATKFSLEVTTRPPDSSGK